MVQFSHLLRVIFVSILLIQQNIEAKSIEKTGKCNKGALWELWLSPSRNMISIHFSGMKSMETAQDWRIIIQNNNRTVFNTTVSEGDHDHDHDHGDEGEEKEMMEVFHIDAKILNRRGRDNIVARATSSKTKETCRASHVYTS